MEINEQIIEIFEDCKIARADGICCLLALFYGYKPTYIPKDLKIKLNASGIYKEELGSITWKVPLFNTQVTAFQWVKDEYVVLFKEHNSEKGGKVRESTARMKRLFAKNPDVRKDDVIGATKMYLLNTDPKYIRFPHYFIEKGKGGDKTYDIIDWIEKYKENQNRGVGRVSHTNTMR